LIDLHTHILPGLDDGPEDIDSSVALARLAAADGTRTVVATPHVREDYPFPLERIVERVEQVNDRLTRASVGVTVVQGAEVALSMLGVLNDETLATICLGSSSSILVESPYQEATDLLEQALFELQLRGFRPVLAHPERSPAFMRNPDRLEVLVERGVLCSVTSASMAGRFGRTVQRLSRVLFERDLVHDVASDAHDLRRRAPGLTAGFRLLDRDLPGLLDHMDWYTRAVPEAILSGAALPPRPRLENARTRRRPFSVRRKPTAR
jgi:protein-tyrosine phosphatase